MKNPTIAFKLTPYQLACGVRKIRQNDPAYLPHSLNKLIKDCFFDYINTLTLSLEPQEEIIQILKEISFLLPSNQKKEKPAIEKLISKVKSRANLPSLEDSTIVKDSSNIKDYSTDSTITTVSDFSPPEDWNQE